MIGHPFDLPDHIRELVEARNSVKDYYNQKISNVSSDKKLNFTFDGNLVGDIGEAIAVELFGLKLCESESKTAIDGYTPDGKNTVQVKATGTGRGPAFRNTPERAEYLLFFDLDFENCKGEIVFNGPEHIAFDMLKQPFDGQRSLTANQIRKAANTVKENNSTMLSLISDPTLK